MLVPPEPTGEAGIGDDATGFRPVTLALAAVFTTGAGLTVWVTRTAVNGAGVDAPAWGVGCGVGWLAVCGAVV